MPVYQRGIDISPGNLSDIRQHIFRRFRPENADCVYHKKHLTHAQLAVLTALDPAKIVETKDRERCALCGAVRGEGYITKTNTVVPGGFEFVFDETDTFGARCLCFVRNCGFSF